jgi:hypothetical protein
MPKTSVSNLNRSALILVGWIRICIVNANLEGIQEGKNDAQK